MEARRSCPPGRRMRDPGHRRRGSHRRRARPRPAAVGLPCGRARGPLPHRLVRGAGDLRTQPGQRRRSLVADPGHQLLAGEAAQIPEGRRVHRADQCPHAAPCPPVASVTCSTQTRPSHRSLPSARPPQLVAQLRRPAPTSRRPARPCRAPPTRLRVQFSYGFVVKYDVGRISRRSSQMCTTTWLSVISSTRPHSPSTTTTSSSRTASLNASCSPAITLPSRLCAASAATMPITPAEASTLAPTARTVGKVISATPSASTTITATVSRRSMTTWVCSRRARRLSGTSVRNLASATSSKTSSSAPTSHAVAAISTSSSRWSTASRPGKERTRARRASWAAYSVASDLERPVRLAGPTRPAAPTGGPAGARSGGSPRRRATRRSPRRPRRRSPDNAVCTPVPPSGWPSAPMVPGAAGPVRPCGTAPGRSRTPPNAAMPSADGRQQVCAVRLPGQRTQRGVQPSRLVRIVGDGGGDQQHAGDAVRDALGGIPEIPSRRLSMRVPGDIRFGIQVLLEALDQGIA